MSDLATNRREELHGVLVRLRDMTYERVRELRRDQADDAQPEPGDDMDLARATADVETHAGLIAQAEEKLKFVDDAITRLEHGKYGECMGCREPIPIERLMVLPFAVYCVDCQQKRNRAKRGWSAGAMIPPYDHQWTVPEEMEEAGESEHLATESVEAQEDMTLGQPEPFGPEEAERAPGARKRRGRPPRKRPAK